jgi:hypothetical protein
VNGSAHGDKNGSGDADAEENARPCHMRQRNPDGISSNVSMQQRPHNTEVSCKGRGSRASADLVSFTSLLCIAVALVVRPCCGGLDAYGHVAREECRNRPAEGNQEK